jgi:hypothetical protein
MELDLTVATLLNNSVYSFRVMKIVARSLLILLLYLPLLAQKAPAPGSQTAVAPVSSSASSAVTQSTEGNPDVRVWVNTATGVYHCPGSRWYGNTKQGEYMTQAEAQKKHYRPAYGKVCRCQSCTLAVPEKYHWTRQVSGHDF